MVASIRLPHFLICQLTLMLRLLFFSLLLSTTTAEQECTMSDDNRCDFAGVSEPTLIYPGGNTRCAYDTNPALKLNSTYKFQVIPGDKDNVVLTFQSGGACFTKETCNWSSDTLMKSIKGSYLYRFNAEPYPAEGIFDRENKGNPFRTWTIINVLYCTADIHTGNTIIKHPTNPQFSLHMNGANNAETVIQWMLKNFGAPKHLALIGQSAGALAVQSWASYVLQHYAKASPSTQVSVISDSFTGWMPETQTEFVKFIGACDNRFRYGQDLVDKCTRNELTLPDIVGRVIQKFPHVPFAFLTPKFDPVQVMFHCLVKYRKSILGAFLRTKECMTREKFSNGINGLLKHYLSNSKNVVSYLSNRDTHVFLERNIMYEIHDQAISIADWIRSIVQRRDTTTAVQSVCEASDRQPGLGCDAEVSTAEFKDEEKDEEDEKDGDAGNDSQPSNDSSRFGTSVLMIAAVLVLLLL